MEGKRRKSYEAFLNIFCPPRANQSQRQQEEEEEEEQQMVLNPTLTSAPVTHGVCNIPSEGEEEKNSSSVSESASERTTTVRKLTRSERKRVRTRKKLKQAASSGRRIIGPMLLPSTTEETPRGIDNALDDEPLLTPLPEERSLPETVIHNSNAADGIGAGNGDYRGGERNNKLKRRRLAKKLSRSTKN